MAVTEAPSTEAMRQIVKQINSGTTYCVDVRAEASEQLIDELEDISTQGLRVDVVTEDEQTLNETLDVEDRTSLDVRIWIRKKITSLSNDEIDPLKLVVRQIFQQVLDFDSSDGRVKVWECDLDSKQNPDKDMLRQNRMFLSTILLRVEVEAS
jgi:DNA-directed RNA polymerase subunit F